MRLGLAVVGGVAIAFGEIMLGAEGLKIVQGGEAAFGDGQNVVCVQFCGGIAAREDAFVAISREGGFPDAGGHMAAILRRGVGRFYARIEAGAARNHLFDLLAGERQAVVIHYVGVDGVPIRYEFEEALVDILFEGLRALGIEETKEADHLVVFKALKTVEFIFGGGHLVPEVLDDHILLVVDFYAIAVKADKEITGTALGLLPLVVAAFGIVDDGVVEVVLLQNRGLVRVGNMVKKHPHFCAMAGGLALDFETGGNRVRQIFSQTG